MSKNYDVIVAGGGLAGVLTAARLCLARPGWRCVILEKNPQLGGRLTGTAPARRLYGYGLNAISDRLFDFWNQTLREDPEAPDLATFISRRQSHFGVLAGGRIVQVEIDQWFTPKGAKALGGLSAAKQWGEVEDICRQGAVRASSASDDEEDEAGDADEAPAAKAAPQGASADQRSHAFSHYWKNTRKIPAAIVLEHFSSAFGLPDVWSAAATALAERAAFHGSRLHCGDFEAALQALVDRPGLREAITVVTGSRIVQAAQEEQTWVIQAEDGTYRAPALVVAQPPWQATAWLPRALWPAHLLQVANKTKPVSVVVLAEQVLQPEVEFPDVTLVPSEKVQILRNGPDEVCFQATIDYELSLQAPAVVKAVKALKRARKKLLTLHPGLLSETNHIALQPIAWAQSPAQSDRRWLERLSRKPLGTPTLAFVGDAYGPSYDGDVNLIESLGRALQTLSSP